MKDIRAGGRGIINIKLINIKLKMEFILKNNICKVFL